jgi:hypothetical protein
MAAIHVKFVQMSVTLSQKNPAMACTELIQAWDTQHAKDWSVAVRGGPNGRKGTGTAKHFFSNGYFKLSDVKMIAKGHQPALIPFGCVGPGTGHGRFAIHLHMLICGVRKHPFGIFSVQSHLSEDGAPSRGEPTKQLITVNGTTNG